ncbi:sodium channel protein type 5 subunit alpha-like [Platysternon megacephalum]|uniref:Sodium channel protein type 5 subunit alpha-like n=1 Tax=Platysternon megacephalum TaxID=55544 RepID=A0A4D9ED54_9SAUR|nr:sodium channel protein type 5 subunit alpha-like [Platysternon megacephalum]
MRVKGKLSASHLAPDLNLARTCFYKTLYHHKLASTVCTLIQLLKNSIPTKFQWKYVLKQTNSAHVVVCESCRLQQAGPESETDHKQNWIHFYCYAHCRDTHSKLGAFQTQRKTVPATKSLQCKNDKL